MRSTHHSPASRTCFSSVHCAWQMQEQSLGSHCEKLKLGQAWRRCTAQQHGRSALCCRATPALCTASLYLQMTGASLLPGKSTGAQKKRLYAAPPDDVPCCRAPPSPTPLLQKLSSLSCPALLYALTEPECQIIALRYSTLVSSIGQEEELGNQTKMSCSE